MNKDRKTMYEIMYKNQSYSIEGTEWYGIRSVLGNMLNRILSDSSKPLNYSQTFSYFFDQEKGYFFWKDKNPEKTENKNDYFYNMIADIENVLTDLDIEHTVNKTKSIQYESSNERKYKVTCTVSCSVSVNKFPEFIDFMHDYQSYCIEKEAGSWLEKMESSDFTKLLADKLYEAHTAKTDITRLGVSYLSFAVKPGEIYIPTAGGRNVFQHINYRDYGYKNIDQEQVKGLEGALLKIIVGKFEALGAKSVKVERGHYIDWTVTVYFDKNTAERGLKDW